MTTKFNAVALKNDFYSRLNMRSGNRSCIAVFLFDEYLNEEQLCLLENFKNQCDELEVLFPNPGQGISRYILETEKVLHELRSEPRKFVLVAFGRIVPAIIRLIASGLAITKLIMVNPEFDSDIITLLSRSPYLTCISVFNVGLLICKEFQH